MTNRFLDKLTRGLMKPSAVRFGLDSVGTAFKLSKLPGAAKIHPWLRPEKTDMRWLPINEDIELPGNAPAPLTLLDRFIEEASCRAVYDVCGCRVAYECGDYPHDIGCLLMGDSAAEGSRISSRQVGVDEAKEHARKAVDAGLVPVIGKARVDNFLFGIRDRGRLLTVCFCCECCCITRFMRNSSMKTLEPLFPRLDSVSIEVTDDCTGCGKCASNCYIEAITIVDEKAVIGEYCRACGRCATVCPGGAVKVRIEDPEFVENAYRRITSYVKHD